MLGVAAFAPLGAQGTTTLASAPDALLLAPVGQPGDFSVPTYLTAPDGDQHRLFVVQQNGLIKVVVDNVTQPTPFLNATSWVVSGGEEGRSRWRSRPTTRRAASSTSRTPKPTPETSGSTSCT